MNVKLMRKGYAVVLALVLVLVLSIPVLAASELYNTQGRTFSSRNTYDQHVYVVNKMRLGAPVRLFWEPYEYHLWILDQLGPDRGGR